MNLQRKFSNKGKVGMPNMLAFLSIIVINIPIIAIISKVDFSANENWEHFAEYLLLDSVYNTFFLVFFTLLLGGVIGVLLASVVALYDFPLKRFFEWVLYIPITIPPYIAAYVFAGMLSYTGIVQQLLRNRGVSVKPGQLDIMNIPGAVLIYSITLYPYIYGTVKSFLEHHSAGFIETARVHGYNTPGILIKVLLPLIRIPLIGGLLLTMMEVVSDYGVVKYFNIQTISSVIFNSWFGMGETGVAIRLSFYVMIVIIGIQVLEELLRGRKKYSFGNGRTRPLNPKALKGVKGYIVTLILFSFITIAFVIPAGQMAVWAILALPQISLTNLNQIILNTLLYSTVSAVIILLLNILIAHTKRWLNPKSGFFISKLTQLGYSMPGAIIAIGTISFFVGLDNTLYGFYRLFDPNVKKLWLSTTVAMLVFAFVVRYLAIGFNSVNSAFTKIGLKYNEAARTLGVGKNRAMLLVEFPLLKKSLITGFILIFVDIVKELPLTLLLRPFNYNTLASRIYEYANDERIYEASVPALILVLLCILMITLLTRINSQKGGLSKK